jgi:hypothetical protein
MGIESTTSAAGEYHQDDQDPQQDAQKQPDPARQAFGQVSKGMDLLMTGLQQTGTTMSEWGQTKEGLPTSRESLAVNVAGEAMDMAGGIGKGIGAVINGAGQWGKNANDLAHGEFNLKDATASTVSSAGKFAYGILSGAGDLATRLLAPGAGHNAYEKHANGLQQALTKGYEGEVGKRGVDTRSKTYDTVGKGADVLSVFLPTPFGKTKAGSALAKLDDAADASKAATTSRLANSADRVKNLGSAVDDFKAGKIDNKQLNEALANANDAYKQGGGKADWDARTRSDFKSHSNHAHAAMANARPESGAPAGNAARGNANGDPTNAQTQTPSRSDVSPQDVGAEVDSQHGTGPGAIVKYTGPVDNAHDARTIKESVGSRGSLDDGPQGTVSDVPENLRDHFGMTKNERENALFSVQSESPLGSLIRGVTANTPDRMIIEVFDRVREQRGLDSNNQLGKNLAVLMLSNDAGETQILGARAGSQQANRRNAPLVDQTQLGLHNAGMSVPLADMSLAPPQTLLGEISTFSSRIRDGQPALESMSRTRDSERVLLNTAADMIKQNPQAGWRGKLLSEQAPCSACDAMIRTFEGETGVPVQVLSTKEVLSKGVQENYRN